MERKSYLICVVFMRLFGLTSLVRTTGAVSTTAAVLIFLPIQGWAQDRDLPELSGQTSVGRVVLYKSPVRTSWFAPVAFSSGLVCAGTGPQRSCNIQVFNMLNDGEAAQLNALAASDGLKIVFFSDVDSNVVGNINEHFLNLPDGLNGKVLSLKTLRMGKSVYAQVAFRTTSDTAERLLSDFNNSANGLGVFDVTFSLNAQQTESYLGIEDGSCLKSLFSGVKDSALKRSQVDELIRKAVAACKLRSTGLDSDEAEQAAKFHLKKTFFTYLGYWSGYKINQDNLAQVKDRYVIYDLVSDPIALSCHAQLPLKANSTPTFECH